MANQRDASKQKRARQNRAEREARIARAKAAQTPKEQRASIATGSPSSPSRSTPKAKESAKAKRGAKPARSAAPARLGQVPVDVDTLQGGFLRKVVQVPGGMQVIMSTVLVLVLTVMNSVVHTMIAKGAPKGAPATQTFFDVYGSRAILLLAPPVILVGNALIFSLHARRRRMWTISAVLLGAFSLVIPQFLFPAGFLGYAVLRSRKVEDPRSPRATSAGGDEAADDAQ